MRSIAEYPFEYALKFNGYTVQDFDGIATVEVTDRYGWRVTGISMAGIKRDKDKTVLRKHVELPAAHCLAVEIVNHLNANCEFEITEFLQDHDFVDSETDPLEGCRHRQSEFV